MTRHTIKRQFQNWSLFPSLYLRENNIIGKQRIAIFIYSSIILVVGVTMNMFNLAGPNYTFFKIANLSQGILTVVIFCLYYYRKMSLAMAMAIFCMVTQTEISVENIYCAMSNSLSDISLIIGNMVLSAIILLLSIIAYLKIMPYLIAFISMSTFATCIYITESIMLINFFFVFLLAFLVLSLLGSKLTSNTSELAHENTNLKDEQQLVLDIFSLSKTQLQSYMTLAREKKLKPEVTSELLNILGHDAEKQICENVAYYLKQSKIEFDRIKEHLPELSTSELEICTLILQDKKLKEISLELGKTQSNITCQRTNIRNKLGLQKSDNLALFLKKRMNVSIYR